MNKIIYIVYGLGGKTLIEITPKASSVIAFSGYAEIRSDNVADAIVG